ncbi:MAG: hypothetical protein IKO42_06895 [Opitutales bacterium]|nr:hypothetical protein [Opitutales bacterium]
MKKIKNKIPRLFGALKKHAFCNIAEGTHSGRITRSAGENIESANLIVKASEGGIAVADAADAPLGVCSDCGEKGEILDVVLPGCAESSVICIASGSVSEGDILYTANGGKVSASIAPGCHKVGVALSSASGGGVVEVDPQGFGMKAYEILACGLHTWAGGAATSDSLTISGIKQGDCAFAVLAQAGANETSVKAAIDAENSRIAFTLDSNGADNSTLINWMVVRNS